MTAIHFTKKNNITNYVFLLALFFVVGCSSTTTSPGNNNNNSSSVVKPKVGSTFSDSVYYKDTSLMDIHSKGQIVVYTLVDTNASIGGKSNVYMFVGTQDAVANSFDTVYQSYEANGDLSVYAPFAAGPFYVGSEWVKFPFTSQATSDIATLQGFIIDSITVTGKVQGSGSGISIVSGQTLTTQKATMNIDAVSMAAGHVPATLNLSYAPSIGYITHQELTDQGKALGLNITGGSNKFLISYTLK